MSSDQSMFDKAKDAASGLKDKITGTTSRTEDMDNEDMSMAPRVESEDPERQPPQPPPPPPQS
jgi:hypothetical protein